MKKRFARILSIAVIAGMLLVFTGTANALLITPSFDSDDEFESQFAGNILAVAEARPGPPQSTDDDEDIWGTALFGGLNQAADDKGFVTLDPGADFTLGFTPTGDGLTKVSFFVFNYGVGDSQLIEFQYDLSRAGNLILRVFADSSNPGFDDFGTIENLNINGNSLGGSSPFVPSTDYWSISNVDYSAPQAITGRIGGFCCSSPNDNPSVRFMITDVNPVPTPGTWTLLLAGLLSFGLYRLRRRTV